MVTELADAALLEPKTIQTEVVQPKFVYDTFTAEDVVPSMASRGIVIAVLISLPFWALVGFTIFLLS